MNARVLPPRLLALSPGTLERQGCERFLRDVELALAAGLQGLLLREPAWEDGALLGLARELRALLGAERFLAVHDRVHLAHAADAQAVHLGFRSLPPTEARAILPEHVAIGLSTHADDERGPWDQADYLFHGPVCATASKRGLKEPVGFDGLARAVRASARPVWAIGGVQPEHVADAFAAGCAGVAVLSGILQAADPAAATRAYLHAFDGRDHARARA